MSKNNFSIAKSIKEKYGNGNKKHIIGGKNPFEANYLIDSYINNGAFGYVYLVHPALGEKKNNKYAAKFSVNHKKKNDSEEILLFEYKTLYFCNIKYECGYGIPYPYYFGSTDDNKFKVLVMDYFHTSVQKRFGLRKKFSPSTLYRLAFDILLVLENLHNNSFIHRDIKADNLMFGYFNILDFKKSFSNWNSIAPKDWYLEKLKNKEQIYLIDFGLSKHMSTSNKYQTERFMGTANYCCKNAHLKKSQSYADDLESLGYVLIMLYKGYLPWTILKGLSKLSKTRQLKVLQEKKMNTSLEELTAQCPSCFKLYFEHIQKFNHSEKPNYSYLRNLFLKQMNIENIKWGDLYDWEIHNKLYSNEEKMSYIQSNKNSFLEKVIDEKKLKKKSSNKNNFFEKYKENNIVIQEKKYKNYSISNVK